MSNQQPTCLRRIKRMTISDFGFGCLSLVILLFLAACAQEQLQGFVSEETFTSPTVSPIPSEKIEVAEIVWIDIPAGPFQMGDDPRYDVTNKLNDELPAPDSNLQTVLVDIPLSYQITQHSITNGQYKQFVDDGNLGFVPLASCGTWDEDGSFDISLINAPVTCVSWHYANAYVMWFGQKHGQNVSLPTEAEWEKAAQQADENGMIFGHVWDWTKTLYEDGNSVTEQRVIRGSIREATLPETAYAYIKSAKNSQSQSQTYGFRIVRK